MTAADDAAVDHLTAPVALTRLNFVPAGLKAQQEQANGAGAFEDVSPASVPRGVPVNTDASRLWGAMRLLADAGANAAAGPSRGFPVVLVTAPGGGTGCSTVTAAVGGLMAIASTQPVVAVDGCPRPWGGLAPRFGPAAQLTFNDLLADGNGRHVPLPRDVAEQFMQAGPSGLRLVSGEEGLRRPGRPLMDAGALLATLGRLRLAYAAALVDSPPPPDPICLAGLDIAAVLLVVCRATPDGAEHALSLLAWLRANGRVAAADGAVVVVNEVSARTDKAVRAAEHRLAGQARCVVRLPYDRLLATPGPLDPLLLARPTRYALTRIAAGVAGACAEAYVARATSPEAIDAPVHAIPVPAVPHPQPVELPPRARPYDHVPVHAATPASAATRTAIVTGAVHEEESA